jgi:glycosidase
MRALLLWFPLLAQAAPQVLKVEPPNWWPGHSLNPVRVMVRGQQFGGATVTAKGLRTANVKVNERGTYLFFDLTIPRSAKPGPADIEVRTSSGVARVPFEITAPLPRAGRFQGFDANDVIYLIMPDRFANGDPSNDDPPISRGLLDRTKGRFYHGGDLRGIIQKLPYLKSLGVTALWLNPVYDNNNQLNRKETYDGQPITDYHGYGATDFYGVDEHLGDVALFRELVDAAHAQGIKLIQDQVANHTGPYHPWVADSPTPTWFNGTAERHLANTWQTWTLLDRYADAATRRATLDGWFIDILPDLNQDDPETRRYLIQNTLWWMGMTGLDGVRQDTWPYVPRAFWRDWMSAIKREYPRAAAVGEFFDGDPALVAFSQGGRAGWDCIDTGVDSMFDFPLYYAVRRAFAEGQPIRDLPRTLAHDSLYPDANRLVTFLGLHDVKRFMNERGASVEGLKLAFTFLLTTRGTPLIYYGDEIAMAGGDDPDNRRDFPGGWPGDARNAFDRAGRTPDQESVHAHVARLGALRAQFAALRTGQLRHLLTDEQQYVYSRSKEGQTLVVAFNNAPQAAPMEIAAPWPEGTSVLDHLRDTPAGQVERGRLRVTLPARSAWILAPR